MFGESVNARTARRALSALMATIAVAMAAPAVAQQVYTLTDIGPQADPVGPGQQLCINASGQIAGASQVNGLDAAWVWRPSTPNATTGTFSWLPVPPGTHACWAEGINSSGQVVGFRSYPNGTYKYKGRKYTSYATVAVLWQPNGTETDLPAANGMAEVAINDSGEIAGSTSLLLNGSIYPLPGVRAVSINNSGQVAGWLDGNGNGYLWTPSSPNGTTGTYVTFPFPAAQVSNAGQVVGRPYYSGGIVALFSTSNGVQDLSAPAGPGQMAAGNSINDLGQVVGIVTAGMGPFVWDSAHGVRYLTDPTSFTILNGAGWTPTLVTGINNSGQIVGGGASPSGAVDTFLLTPQ